MLLRYSVLADDGSCAERTRRLSDDEIGHLKRRFVPRDHPVRLSANRHDRRRWFRAFKHAVVVATDALLQADRRAAIEALLEVVDLKAAIDLTSPPEPVVGANWRIAQHLVAGPDPVMADHPIAVTADGRVVLLDADGGGGGGGMLFDESNVVMIV